jgi:hypothetical protein
MKATDHNDNSGWGFTSIYLIEGSLFCFVNRINYVIMFVFLYDIYIIYIYK